MKYKIIVTLGQEDLLDYKNPALTEADILEIRLDLLESFFIMELLSGILTKLDKPVLFTYRNPKDSSEASNTNLSFTDIKNLLSKFNTPQNYLDIELDQEKSIFDSIEKCKYTIIYSYHDFENSISKEEMQNWITKKQSPKCIYKFAVSPNDISELESFLHDLSVVANQYRVIGIAMGEDGVYSRLFGDSFGSFATYCCIGKPRAPGQINVTTLKKIRMEYENKPLPSTETKFI